MSKDRFSEEDLALARDRFFPNWWLHQVSEDWPQVTDMPHYLVTCADEAERELALASKPRYLSARIKVENSRVSRRS